ncbi:MAG: hypothetical protein ACI8YQ_004580 [Polaribacter sp.]|jgi:hypothetical protein
MITFSCTGKVLKRLKTYKVIENTKDEINFHNWYVDQINLGRKNYFLFTHSTSLFSFFVYAGTKKELVDIESIFKEKAIEVATNDLGLPKEYILDLFPGGEKYRFNKTNSRSVLGSMSDFKYQITAHIDHDGGFNKPSGVIAHYLNRCPMGALKNDSPTKVLGEMLRRRFKEKNN